MLSPRLPGEPKPSNVGVERVLAFAVLIVNAGLNILSTIGMVQARGTAGEGAVAMFWILWQYGLGAFTIIASIWLLANSRRNWNVIAATVVLDAIIVSLGLYMTREF